jgi:(1->4)-alpha-D-glucan 1-alpha-D-glucosylmutase
LISLNEVGGDPRRFGISVAAFHHANQERLSCWPHTMLNSSTHDSKRSEDVRARINVLSEVPDFWETEVRRWSRVNRSKKRKVEANLAPSKNDEYALYQILIGTWPLEDFEDNESSISFFERIKSYMVKAVREAKVHSSWINPEAQYEDAVVSFVGALLENRRHDPFLEEFLAFQRRIARLGMYNSLSLVLLKLTCPGIPDIYRGNEVWNFSLVDPDNRRFVDLSSYERMLDELQSFVSVPKKELPERVRELVKTMEDGRIKLYVTWKTLSLRWQCIDLFQSGAYVPIEVRGKNAENLCAYARQYEDKMVVVAVPRLYTRLCGVEAEVDPLGEAVWRDTWLETPFCSTGTQFKNVFTGEVRGTESFGGPVGYSVAQLLAFFPVALLIKV